MVALSILDVARLNDQSARTAYDNSRALALHAEELGYHRFWVAEHHNMVAIGSSSPAVLIGYIAAGTRSIRVGAGGVMLPNHSPYIVAEQFGMLSRLYPDRIDLGLGRAPGTDQDTVRAIRRSLANGDNYPRDVLELQHYFADAKPGQRLVAMPAAGTHVPLWILGSSLYSAQLAAELGLPYGFASHFAPDLLLPALDIYRTHFTPSRQLERPYAMVGVNVIAADSDAEARRLATTQQQSFTAIFRDTRGVSVRPIDDIEDFWTPYEKAQVMRMLARSIVGSPQTVNAGIASLIAETQADELMIVSDVYDFGARMRSVELIANSTQLLRNPTKERAQEIALT